ncbi:hypothetical protein Pcinc_025659 [Petrolisthes cinctipes]|uniref:Alpha-1,6-mannosyl-glycoprotein 2-beta-N-acetylglucosaminyltransferase n=1 Tax=Petrolisthes cinctipes TaxID=88211 RepID=A0AAE1FA28_PETCI|nr:hypothetical protein Pcinc_025659 [Petrolisthes cinctipes]
MRVSVFMMRWRRELRRVLVALLFICMTVKLQLELRMLDSAETGGGYAPWWGNETLGHLRAFPKNSGSQNYSKMKGILTLNETHGKEVSTSNTDAVMNIKLQHKTMAKPRDIKLPTPTKDIVKNAKLKPLIDKTAPKPKQRGALSLDRSKGGGSASKAAPKKGGKVTVLNRGVSHDVDSKEVSLTKENIARIKKQLEAENKLQKIYNVNRYGPVLNNTSILLVQVHRRLENLAHLVKSMKAVRGINESLVIFSHDFWDECMNNFVRNITEFRVMQIFFPFSIQLHPFTFPGRDPRDCPWNVKGHQALTCLNRAWPDSYGHFREAAFTQIKHHWWWKLHRVFEGLRVTGKSYSGHVVFLEEDHYLAPDLLHVLHLMVRLQPTLCKDCLVLTLGNYNKLNAAVYKNFVERGDWWVTKYNMGFALDASAWWTLRKCHRQFCHFDDYNWDWTMTSLVQTCHKPRIPMFSIRLSRVAHVGSCGTHVKKKSCDVGAEVMVAHNRFKAVSQYLFPKTLILQSTHRSSGKTKKGNGGWGDYRDQQLCLAIANGTATQNTIERLQFPDNT